MLYLGGHLFCRLVLPIISESHPHEDRGGGRKKLAIKSTLPPLSKL